jgi:hypothetical protein
LSHFTIFLRVFRPSREEYTALAHYKPGDLMKIRGLGMKSVAIIAEALESMGIIGDAEEWLR